MAPNVAKRRFGRTELQIPVLTCGGMRLQQTWSPGAGFTMADVETECQRGLEEIIAKSMELGINHFETARGYGSSELQYGVALKKHMDAGLFKREDFILQTKVPPKETASAFRETMEKSFATLDLAGNNLGHVDLFAFHGINKPEKLKWTLEHCLPIVRSYQAEGKIRFVGFSTHGMEPLISKACSTGEFDYVNLHYHFIGSYTASGTGSAGSNWSAIEAARAQDMGVFIISPTDKGGALYKAPRKFAELCAPLSPIEFHNLWLLNHPEVHTLVVGAARASDFDEHVKAIAKLDRACEFVTPIEARLRAAYAEACGAEWTTGWWRGLPDPYGNVDGAGALQQASRNPHAVHYCAIAWLFSICKAWGFHEYARERYSALHNNAKKFAKLREEAGTSCAEFVSSHMNDWGPGCAPPLAPAALSDADLAAPMAGAPCEAQVLHALAWAVRNLAPKRAADADTPEPTMSDMRPWTCWPDRPKRRPTDWLPYVIGKCRLLACAIRAKDVQALGALSCADPTDGSDGGVEFALWGKPPGQGSALFGAAWCAWADAGYIELDLTPHTCDAESASQTVLRVRGTTAHAHVDVRSQRCDGELRMVWKLECGDYRLASMSCAVVEGVAPAASSEAKKSR